MMLDERKQHILRVVVRKHVETAEPVSSEHVCADETLGVRAATVRNEFAAMSDMGYLRQPHTSSGRVPSDMGYRYYVDRLMSPRRMSLSDAPQMTDREPTAIDDLVAGTCRLLSTLTKLTALATSPTSTGLKLKWLDLHEVAVGRIIALAVWSNGQVRQTVIDLPGASHSLLDRVRRSLSTALLESTADKIQQTSIADFGLPPGLPTALAHKVWEFVRHAARDVSAPELFVDGTSFLTRQPEFLETSALEFVLSVLDEETTIGNLLLAAGVGDNPQVVIGAENPVEPLRSCSLVAASYGTPAGVQGSIGVCGPTRMDYDRSVAAVRFAARSLSAALASLLPT